MRRLLEDGKFIWMGAAIVAISLVMFAVLHTPSYGPWLQRDLNILRRELPPNLPVKVVIENAPGAFASCSIVDSDDDGVRDLFLIRIDPGLDRVIAMDSLVHEWAHTLSWDEEVKHGDHCDAWGIAYARVYRALLP